jgi:hypothetical protein
MGNGKWEMGYGTAVYNKSLLHERGGVIDCAIQYTHTHTHTHKYIRTQQIPSGPIV